jgi:hypothetical protein
LLHLVLLSEADVIDDFEDLVVEVGDNVVGVGTRVGPLLSVVAGLTGGVLVVMVDSAGEGVGVIGTVIMAGGG